MRIIQKYIKYEQKNIIIDTFSIHYGSVFACCSTGQLRGRHGLHVPLLASEGYVLCAYV